MADETNERTDAPPGRTLRLSRMLGGATYLRVAHGQPARTHELALDEEGLDQRRAGAEDGLERLTAPFAHVLDTSAT